MIYPVSNFRTIWKLSFLCRNNKKQGSAWSRWRVIHRGVLSDVKGSMLAWWINAFALELVGLLADWLVVLVLFERNVIPMWSDGSTLGLWLGPDGFVISLMSQVKSSQIKIALDPGAAYDSSMRYELNVYMIHTHYEKALANFWSLQRGIATRSKSHWFLPA